MLLSIVYRSRCNRRTTPHDFLTMKDLSKGQHLRQLTGRNRHGFPTNRRRGRQLQITQPAAFTVEETAHRLGFRHRSTIYDLIQRGELRACRLGGGSLRVPEDAIVEYLQRAIDAEV
jgi:excisionase family DNA binding protein